MCWYFHRCCSQVMFHSKHQVVLICTATCEAVLFCKCVHCTIYLSAFANRRSWEHWHSFALSPQECRIAHPIVKCTYCRSEFQQERWDMCTHRWIPAFIHATIENLFLFHFMSFVLDVNRCLLFAAKPTQSARNVPRMSNSLEQWVTSFSCLFLPWRTFNFSSV